MFRPGLHAERQESVHRIVCGAGLWALCCTGLGACDSNGDHRSITIPAQHQQISSIGSVELATTKTIDGLASTVTPDEQLHIAALVSDMKSAPTSTRAMVVVRGNPTTDTWAAPLVQPAPGGPGPELVALGARHYVFAGRSVSAWEWASAAMTLENHGDLIVEPGAVVRAFRIVALDDAMHGMAHIYRPRGSPRHSIESFVWSGRGAPRWASILELPTDTSGRAHLALRRSGRGLEAAVAVNQLSRRSVARNGKTIEIAEPVAALFHVQMPTGGQPVVRQLPLDAAGCSGRKGQVEFVSSVDLAHAEDSSTLVFAASGVHVLESDAKGAWGPVRCLVAHDADSVAIAHRGDRHAVTWIDRRNRKSDRRAGMPIAGVPWSDDPDWANNDVFIGDLPLLTRAAQNARQLTSPGAFARHVQFAGQSDPRFVVWSGRPYVGKSIATDSGAPQIYYKVLSGTDL